jgi:hypothetical protein
MVAEQVRGSPGGAERETVLIGYGAGEIDLRYIT